MKPDEFITEDLRKWFKEKWVRFGPDGEIRGDCARGSDSEGKPKCLPQSKAHALGKKGRKYAAAKKRREDPNPERRGKAKNVATKKNEDVMESEKRCMQCGMTNCSCPAGSCKCKPIEGWIPGKGFQKKGVAEEQLDELKCWPGYHRVKGTKAGFPGSCAKNTSEGVEDDKCPHCGGELVSEDMLNEKKDACYYKVKSRYKVWPSAYASGALVQCRKKGAKNWGTKSESSILKGLVAEEITENVIIGPSEDGDPMNPQVAILGGGGSYDLKTLYKKAKREVEQLAMDINRNEFRRSASNIKQLANTLNTVVQAHDELKSKRSKGGPSSRGISTDIDEVSVTDEGQIYSTGGGPGEAQRKFVPKKTESSILKGIQK